MKKVTASYYVSFPDRNASTRFSLFVPKFGDNLYAAANTKVGKIRKRDGKLIDTYNAGK